MHIDLWTLGLQLCNLLVLLALLRWLFYRPLLAVIEARRQGLQQQREQAQTLHQQAQAEAASLARQRELAVQAQAEGLQAARQQAEQESAATLQAAREAAQQCLQQAQAAIVREREQAGQALQDEAAALALALAEQLLRHTPVADALFWPALRQHLQNTPAAQRAAWWAGPSPALRVISAHPLEAEVQARLTAELAQDLGAAPQLQFDTDPALIGGLELHFAHGVLGQSWAAELRAAAARWQEGPGPEARAPQPTGERA